MDFLDAGASAATGGLLGMAGTVIGRVAGYFESRQANAQERQRWEHERERAASQAAHETAEGVREDAHAERLASYSSLEESLRSDAAIGDTYRWVQAVRALVRPVLTPLLWAIYLVVFFSVVEGNARHFLTEEAQGDFIGYFIANIAFAASAATLWWFGDRALPPRGPRS